MPVKTIRLELARNKNFPDGSANRGYEIRAPLDASGQLDHLAWPEVKDHCTVRRFWDGEPEEAGRLVHTRGGRWLIHYDGTDPDGDEPIFKFDRHHFVQGEYVTITEHDGEQLTFRVAAVR